MLSTFAWGLASVYMRHRKMRLHPLMSSSWQMLFASFLLVPLGWLLGERPSWPWPAPALEAFAYLVLFGSLVGFVAYVYIVDKLPAAVVGSYTYVNPLVAAWIGWFFMGENLDRSFWIAGALVLAGVFLVQRPTAR
jgi:drug/metabolite transporter (DMT)-like permease